MTELDAMLATVGEDPENVFAAFVAEVAKPAGRRHEAYLAELRNRIGEWPHPDTPDAEIVAGAGTPGQPAGLVLQRLQAWPEAYRRTAIIAYLRERVGDDPNQFSH